MAARKWLPTVYNVRGEFVCSLHQLDRYYRPELDVPGILAIRAALTNR